MEGYLEYIDFIRKELLVLIPVLIFFGKMLKDFFCADTRFIPIVLGVVAIALSAVWVVAATRPITVQDILMAVFVSIVQGILTAGTAVYGNQLYKQAQSRQI